MKNTFRYLSVVVAIFLVFGCSKSTEVSPADTYLVSSNEIVSLTKSQMTQKYLGNSQTQFIALFLNHDIKAYKIVYKTKNPDGAEVQASGCLILPNPTDKTLKFSLVSEQHGTIRQDSEAPSYFNPNTEAELVGTFLASSGYIVALPDYLGYGTSNTMPHPYIHKATLASASLDMIRASREFLSKNASTLWNNKLFIAGYSEGGFATMALQKKIEEETGSEFNLVASSSGAGPHNVTNFMNTLITQPTSGIASNNTLYLWVLDTYNRVYKINRKWTDYVKEPFATQLTNVGVLQTSVNQSLNLVFTDGFKNGITNKSDATFLNAVKDNDIFDWKPRTPLRLYHGDADNTVFFSNSQTAFDAMKARGASVELIRLQGKDHGTALTDFLLGTFQWFGEKK